jgi:hypothetical protein
MEQTIIEWIKIIEGAGPLFEILLGALGLGGGWVGLLFRRAMKAKKHFLNAVDKSDLKNEDFMDLVKKEGVEWVLKEAQRRLIQK